MRVLHIVNLRRFGGIQNLVIELSVHQSASQDMDVAILSVLKGGSSNSSVSIFEGNMKSGFDISPKKLWTIYRRLEQYDILHFHGFFPQIALCSIFAGRQIVHTEHGTFKSASRKQSWKDYLKKRILGFAFLKRFPARVVFVSEWLRRDVGLETGRGVVIHNGTNVTGQPADASARSRITFNVLFAGRLVPGKRAGSLINAFALLEENEGMLLQIVGDGPARAELETQARLLLDPETYSFHGYCPDIDQYYDAADLVVLPTRGEPFGLVVIEAMRHGVPVICFSDGGGAVEILEGVDDRLVVDDEQHLADAISYWRRHPEERAEVGGRLREKADSYFTLDRMADEYRQLYRQILEG